MFLVRFRLLGVVLSALIITEKLIFKFIITTDYGTRKVIL
jgi:hypothetical protein